MKLWLISQNENNSRDTYDSMVVAAENEEAAKEILPPHHTEWEELWSAWAPGPDKVAVEYLGEATEGTLAGIILASYNAG